MNIINKNDGHKEIVDFAVDYLQRGKVIAYPTETVYGLGCDAANSRAVLRLKRMKSVESERQLLVLVDSLKMAKEYAVFSGTALKIFKAHNPGPLSLILLTTEAGRRLFKSKTIGLRWSSNEVATALVKKLGRPIVSTSANISGSVPARSGLEVAAAFVDAADEPDVILDAGKLNKSKGSTIVDCTGPAPIVVRKGDANFKL